MTSLKSANDVHVALKSRREQERKLGAQIDVLMRQADDGATPGCGLCSVWKRLTGRQRAAALSVVAERVSVTGTATGVATGTATQARLFGMKKADPHAKLAEAAASMETRISQLELKAASERAETKKLMQLGQKPSAIRMLKRAKATEKQLEANQASLMAVEQQVDLMAQAQMQKQVASALASSSKGMKAQKKLLKNAESAVDEAQDARDMADDLGQVMAEFANNGNSHDDDDELMAELQQMMDEDPPNGNAAMQDVDLDEEGAEKKAEVARLEARLKRYDESVEARRLVESMPAAPSAPLTNGKAKMTTAQQEKEALLKGSTSAI